MAALSRPRVVLIILLAIMALAAPAGALADGRAVLADFEDNGQIDGCYPLADYDEALALAPAGDAQYGALVDVIEGARVTNVERPGEPCAQSPGTTTAPAAAGGDGDDGGGGSPLLWAGIVVVIVAGAGAAVWARMRRSGRTS